jgi:excisionase family DNA binding protein
MTPIPEYLTTGEVAELFRVDDSTVARWAELGKIPSTRTPGGRRRYPKDAIVALLVEPQPEQATA